MDDRGEISLLYVHDPTIGYGRLGVELAAALTRAGVTVYDRQHRPEADPTVLEEMLTQARPGPRSAPAPDGPTKDTGVVAWVSVPTHAAGWREGQRAVIFTMFETDYVPESFRENLHAFDTVVVPCEQNRVLFAQHHPNVVTVPLGVDPNRWGFTPRPPLGRYFRFLHGGSGSRKGQDVAHKAFLAAFPEGSWGDGPVPYMTFKSPRGMMKVGADGRPAETGQTLHLTDRMECVQGHVSAEEEVALYAAAHCYVQPSRGEGFGLQPLQAIAQGLPTILTDAHGHADFAHLGYGIDSTKVPADYFIYGNHPDMCWWEPDVDDLVDQMRWVYENYGQAQAHAEHSAKEVAAGWTWDDTARRFIDAVGADALQAPYQGDGSWFEPESELFLVRVHREVDFEVAGRAMQMVPGQDYWETADVKRVLFESGKLDLSCLEPKDGAGTGLLESQVARLEDYRAHRSWCRACGQRLGSGVTRADEILAEGEVGA